MPEMLDALDKGAPPKVYGGSLRGGSSRAGAR